MLGIKSRLMSGAAALALIATPALVQAQDYDSADYGKAATMQARQAAGTEVRGSNGKTLGEVDHFALIDQDLVLVLADRDGRQVPLPMDKVSYGDKAFTAQMSADEIADLDPVDDNRARRISGDATLTQAIDEVTRRQTASEANMESQAIQTAGGRFVVEQAEPKVNVDVPDPEVSVNQRAPEVTVKQPEPTVTVSQAKPDVKVQQRAPLITVEQAKPTVSVDIPEPTVTVTMPDPDVEVAEGKPQVDVQQPKPRVRFVRPEPKVVVKEAQPQVEISRAQPEVDVNTSDKANANVEVSQGKPQVDVQSAGKADVEVSQADPQVKVQQAEGADVNVDQAQAEVNVQKPGEDGQQTAQADTGQAKGQSDADRRRSDEVAQMRPEDGFSVMQTAELTADDLSGAPVYGENGDEIGELDEILLDDRGNIDRVVMDVGGFLGIGEKPVALDMSQVSIQQADNGGEIRAYIPHTEDELEGMKAYDG